ncbi:LodA/GoxA family CTQ-dependent oxidase [Roseibacillus persicicus]|uniref:3-isopropylmalate dehydrogenase n=1 Tax=Roseibacillus persicicus TaxID=454148 RepID=A0A918WL03_9BACT|nr:LodA/GoxA family CTQ-dependent oxidase [Roseibacillus persicicus]GHC55992.1 3-isopropylmalate dehydrogenase [Roseibacillus persicicus]
MKYAIYPPIGISRLGNSADSYFLSPETKDLTGIEVNNDGQDTPVTKFKDDEYKVKRQGSRFTLFEIPEEGDPRPAQLPAGAIVKWSVSLTNKKDAVERPNAPLDFPASMPIPVADGRDDRVIKASANVDGTTTSAELKGNYQETPIKLGEIFSDSQGRLVVLGGEGVAEAAGTPGERIEDFYNNPGWIDDTCDGPVTAIIELADGTQETASPSWVIIGPPDFAPAAIPIVTLYDVIQQVALDEGWINRTERPNFEADIRPIIERAVSHQHVNNSPLWGAISEDWEQLSDPSPAAQGLRQQTKRILDAIGQFEALQNFTFREWQNDALALWASGDFDTANLPQVNQSDEMTRAVLDTAIGQGFFPGIEAGVNMLASEIYEDSPKFEYRLDHSKLEAGDLTALMALPWQADFLKCNNNWWPAQRPDRAPQRDGSFEPWLRPSMDHERLIDEIMRLGVIHAGNDGTIFEQQRDPQLEES